MHLFTWNISKRTTMARRACSFLARLAASDHVIATFQEWPEGLSALDGGPEALQMVPRQGSTCLLYSNKLDLIHHDLDSSGRGRIARFRVRESGAELTVVALHWYSRDSRGGIVDPAERGGAMALFRHHLEARLETPTVIMGDFNASPLAHEREMCSEFTLFANTQRHRVKRGKKSVVMGQEKQPWFFVEPSKPANVGTYFWPRTGAWTDLDHLIITPDLLNQIKAAEVLTTMEGESLLSKKKLVPRSKEHASDHLPVLCEIHYQ